MKYRLFSLFSLIFLSFIFCIPQVFAADPHLTIKNPEEYAAKFVSQSIPDPITIEAGATKTVTVQFKNIGTSTWNAAGANYISAYTVEPKYRISPFAGGNWIGKGETGKLAGLVKPGALGTLTIDLTAPLKVGDYTEEFHLAAENMSWVNKGYFFFKITVVPAKKITLPKSSSTDNPAPASVPKIIEKEAYQAEKILQSKKEIRAVGGEQIKFVVSFKNTGTKEWKKYSLIAPEGGSLAVTTQIPNFGDESWSSKRVIFENKKIVKPNEVVRETFYFRTPKTKGDYKARFVLAADGKPLIDAVSDVSVTVTENAPRQYKEPKLKNDNIAQVDIYKLKEEPYTRVAVFKLEKPEKDKVVFLSDESDYDVVVNDDTKYILSKGEKANLSYKNDRYFFKSENEKFESKYPIRFLPKDGEHSVFSIPNLERTIEWHKGMNFDSYRGRMEYRVTDDKKSAYVINETLLEDYVAGIAETSNGTHYEFIKAQQTAARNYAYYVMSSGEKYSNGHFDLVAHTGDQLFLGYRSEALRPRVVQATKDTRGAVITYDLDKNPSTPNVVVITPYFGNSNGKTKGWKEVWGGSEKPWLMPVVADYDKRDKKKMYGHGVGMSQRDAMIRADEERLDYKQLLKYYYTGVSIEKLYP
jgi:hypothetical protein